MKKCQPPTSGGLPLSPASSSPWPAHTLRYASTYSSISSNLGFLNQEKVFHGRLKLRSGFLKSFVLGLIFAAGWTPCIGPVLGAIIGLATFGGESAKGTLLLVAYSLGLGLPFIAAALAVDQVTGPLKRARRLRVAVPIVSGVLVVGIGFLMLTNMLVQMPQYFDWGGGAIG